MNIAEHLSQKGGLGKFRKAIGSGLLGISLLTGNGTPVGAEDGYKATGYIDHVQSGSLIFSHEAISGALSVPETGRAEYKIMQVLEMMVKTDREKEYFDLLHDRLYNNLNRYFSISASYSLNPDLGSIAYNKIEAFYFQDGIDNPQYALDKGRAPDLYVSVEFSEDSLVKSLGVLLQLKSDETLSDSKPTLERPEPIILPEADIKGLHPEYFTFTDDLDEYAWVEYSEGAFRKRVKFNDALVIVTGNTNGILTAYFEVIDPNQEEEPKEELDVKPHATPPGV